MEGMNKRQNVFSVAKMRLPILLKRYSVGDEHELAYVQYMEVTDTIFGVDGALECVCLTWAGE